MLVEAHSLDCGLLYYTLQHDAAIQSGGAEPDCCLVSQEAAGECLFAALLLVVQSAFGLGPHR